MATRTKDGSGHGREKSGISPSTPQNIDGQHGRRTPRSTPKSSVSGLPGKDSSTPSEKPVPHYLKPTISSTNEAHQYVKKPASEGSTTRRLTSRRSFEKPPSPSQTQKAPLSASSKEKQLKPSTSLPKTASSTKPILGKMVKTAGKAKSMRKEVGVPKKKETKATSTSTTTSTSHEGEEKESIRDVTVEELKADDEEHAQVEIPLVQDQTAPNSEEAGQNISNEACNASLSLDEHEVGPTDEEVDDENDENTEGEDEANHEVKEEDGSDGEPNNQHSEESLVHDREHEEEGVEEKQAIEIKKVITDSEDDDGKDIDNAGENEESAVKKPDGDMEGLPDNTKPKSENATPRRPDVRGKKEAPQAYNDVIEETASKLAEQRKNKVRALAGAFETVISLQNPEG